MKQIPIFIITWVLPFFICTCKQGNAKFFTPALPGYSGPKPVIITLKRPLKEISGLFYLNDHRILANNDEQGKLFFVDPATGEFEASEFGPKGDYEDVAEAGGFYYVLNSKGILSEISESDYKVVATYTSDFGNHMEFESLCYDKANDQLLLICKECGKKSYSNSCFRFNLSTKQWVPGTYFTISWSDIRRLTNDNNMECKPSAAAINPINGKLYIIASVGKVLLQCTASGTLEAAYRLNAEYFPQPEGITFSPAGTMYISNEGGEGKATLLTFSFKP